MSEYAADVKKHAPNATDAQIASIVKYCGIALRNKDSSLVSGTDKSELDRVRDGFAFKKLGLAPADAEAGMKTVLEKMKGVNQKSRVTFYYLLAEATGTLGKLG
jgi:hypothetical protein